MRTVPRGRHGAGAGPSGSGARSSRRPYAAPGRSASWSSSPWPASAVTRAAGSKPGARSSSPPQRRGYSSAATRPRPHTRFCAARGATPSSPVETAPPVRHHSVASTPASANACTRARVRAVPTGTTACSGCGRSSSPASDTTRSKGRGTSAIRRASVRRSLSAAVSSTRVTVAPASSSARHTSSTRGWPVSGTSSRQWPDHRPVPPPDSAFQVTR